MMNDRLPTGGKIDLAEAAALFDEIDADENGTTDMEEFKSLMNKYYPGQL